LFYTDLVFVCSGSNGQQSIQLWINERDQGFKMELQANLPNGAGPLSFADIGEPCENSVHRLHSKMLMISLQTAMDQWTSCSQFATTTMIVRYMLHIISRCLYVPNPMSLIRIQQPVDKRKTYALLIPI
jgi:hypothetical protein